MREPRRAAIAAISLWLLASANGVAVADAAPPPSSPLSARAQVGRALFFDPKLSASGQQSCASCHDPAHAYAPANDQPVQRGGPQLATPGLRAVPSLMYKRYTPQYANLTLNPDGAGPAAPGGGFGWDGRADTLAAQAAIPLLSPFEMANASAAAVAKAVRKANYADDFRAAFGPRIFDDPKRAFAAVGEALQAFQSEDRSFHPYSSRFDRFRNNKRGGELSEQELRGLKLYVAPDKGNCNACHLLGAGLHGSLDVTSDYSYAAIGVPRNPAIPANANARWFDFGLCGPLRHDPLPVKQGQASAACGQFKTPILRNVATRQVFMHNGRFTSLREVLEFYATRDSNPERWYPRDAKGAVQKLDDLPLRYRGNLDTQLPLDGRGAGSAPALSEVEIDDLLAFLQTLTDAP